MATYAAHAAQNAFRMAVFNDVCGEDTPETVKPNTPPQHFGKEASEFTKAACLGKTVRVELVEGHTRDKYDRLLAYIYLPDGRCLNTVLVAEGYAYADPRYDHPHKDEYARLQARAKKAKLGLWKDLKPEDLPYYYQPQTQPGRMP
ncbi:MAG: thermonuclease family protein [Planctomycetota bacterium]|nr:thermonuclease family protein [Planctomycetota bacterium]